MFDMWIHLGCMAYLPLQVAASQIWEASMASIIAQIEKHSDITWPSVNMASLRKPQSQRVRILSCERHWIPSLAKHAWGTCVNMRHLRLILLIPHNLSALV